MNVPASLVKITGLALMMLTCLNACALLILPVLNVNQVIKAKIQKETELELDLNTLLLNYSSLPIHPIHKHLYVYSD